MQSSRQFVPAFVVAPTDGVAGLVDKPHDVVEELAGAGSFLIVDEELPPDDFEFAIGVEVLAGQADLAV